MRRTVIFAADNGEIISLIFTKNPHLDNITYGKWNTDNNEIELCTEAWDSILIYKDIIRKLKPMMEQLQKYSPSSINIEQLKANNSK